MLELVWGVLQNGKTVAGMVIMIVSSVLGVLTADDVTIIQAIIANPGNAVGLAVGVAGIAHKVIKAVRAARAARVPA